MFSVWSIIAIIAHRAGAFAVNKGLMENQKCPFVFN